MLKYQVAKDNKQRKSWWRPSDTIIILENELMDLPRFLMITAFPRIRRCLEVLTNRVLLIPRQKVRWNLKEKLKKERKSNILISFLANQTRKNKLFCYQSKLKTVSAKDDVTIAMKYLKFERPQSCRYVWSSSLL